ncbi:MAG: ADP-ribose pyrophosphatase [Candidatus Accumulibacter appositus]|uniref:GDP-mannose pyrophosphatase n=1 Tax=Candidatus Accumulibacter appositus TaxID=1454003 RepID=A0A011PLW2_9PROT|nr:NUDIX hydrolase [Accumulibacter sp.]EXI77962.1 MAG: ADP-ribose pyrophosphatase [Candidatus Accumulibacter appositus]HRF06423.1 NUDIX hydrolase [Accumulibacter sp.]
MKDDYPHLREEQIESSQVFRGRLLDVRLDRVRLPDGEECQREYVRHQGAVVVIAQLDNGQLLLVRQHRYPLGRSILELPAGKIDAGEAILETGRRELLEETGYGAVDWRYLGVMHPCVGYSNERIEIFLARGLRREAEQSLDCGEFMDVLSLSLQDALAAVKSGEITDAKTITGLFWAEKAILGGW